MGCKPPQKGSGGGAEGRAPSTRAISTSTGPSSPAGHPDRALAGCQMASRKQIIALAGEVDVISFIAAFTSRARCPAGPRQHGCAGAGGVIEGSLPGAELNFSRSHSSCGEGFAVIARMDGGKGGTPMAWAALAGCSGRAGSSPPGDGGCRSPFPPSHQPCLHGKGFSCDPSSRQGSRNGEWDGGWYRCFTCSPLWGCTAGLHPYPQQVPG